MAWRCEEGPAKFERAGARVGRGKGGAPGRLVPFDWVSLRRGSGQATGSTWQLRAGPSARLRAGLENADDTRNTPAAALTKLLLARGTQAVAHDPYVREADWERVLDDGVEVPLTASLDEALSGADCAALVTRHRDYTASTPERLRAAMRTPAVVDGRDLPLLGEWAKAGLVARAIGKGRL